MGPEIVSSEITQKLSLQESLRAFCESAVFNRLSPKSQMAYRGDLADLLRYFKEIEITSVASINSQNITDYLAAFRPPTMLRRKAAIKKFFGWATAEQITAQDPTEDLPTLKRESITEPLNHLSDEECQKLLSAAQNKPRDLALLTIALKTGALPDELARIKASDVKPVNDHYAIGLRKGKKRREVILARENSQIISNYLESINPRGPLFPSRSNRRKPTESLSRQGLWLIFKRYGKQIGRPDLNPRILRQTYVMNFAGTPRQLAEILGITLEAAYSPIRRRRLTTASQSAQTPQIPEP